MSFKKGDVVFVSEENLKQMLIPISEGPLFTLKERVGSNVVCWRMEDYYVVLESMLQHPTELLKALV